MVISALAIPSTCIRGRDMVIGTFVRVTVCALSDS